MEEEEEGSSSHWSPLDPSLDPSLDFENNAICHTSHASCPLSGQQKPIWRERKWTLVAEAGGVTHHHHHLQPTAALHRRTFLENNPTTNSLLDHHHTVVVVAAAAAGRERTPTTTQHCTDQSHECSHSLY